MTLEEFQASIDSDSEPPAEVSPALRALWYDAAGDWEEAHETAQEVASPDGAWVHAYLHRKEGDIGNARYWYDRAGKSEYRGPLQDEWAEMTSELLSAAR